MTVVVDASVLVAGLVNLGPEGAWAERILVTHRLAAPMLAQVEVTNVLRRWEAARIIDSALAETSLQDLMETPLALFPFAPFTDRVWSLRANLTSYDAWYVAVAESLDVPLVTLDRKLARAPGPTCPFVLPE